MLKKTTFFILSIFLSFGLISASPTNQPLQTDVVVTEESTKEASLEANLTSTASAQIVKEEIEQKIQEKQDEDITQTTGKKKDELTAYLEKKNSSPIGFTNFLQHWIQKAINNGLSANIIVLIILFPTLASIIAASRHIIGLRGFGIYTPAVLSIAFASTGYLTGIITFAIIMIAVLFFRKLFKKIQLPYLPKTALLLWGVSLTTLLFLLSTSIYQITELFLNISIFPLLIIILLSENFTETQLFSSQKEAVRLTSDTLLLASICYVFLNAEIVQKFVIIHPELMILATLIVNIIVGRYKGLRFLEYRRFKNLIKK
jgi:hypothetical protein